MDKVCRKKDIPQLIQMRWDFTVDDYEGKPLGDSHFKAFQLECHTFL